MKTICIILFLLLPIAGCTQLTETAEYNYNKENILLETCGLIRNNYPYLAFKNINIDSLYSKYHAKLTDYEGDRIYNLLYDLLGELKDGHVWFYTQGGFIVTPYTPPRMIKDQDSFSSIVIRNYFTKPLELKGDNRIEFGMLENNIGYIYISSMKLGNGKWIEDISAIINQFKNTDGLILDVRGNGGGSDIITQYIIRNFLPESILSPIWADSKGHENPRFTIYPFSYTYKKNVALLQNGKCFSSAEGFINVMRELPNVTCIGDTTAGGTGAPLNFSIPDNLSIHISTKAEFTYQRKQIEWNGLEPDILVKQTKKDLDAGKDLQLEAAINFLINNK